MMLEYDILCETDELRLRQDQLEMHLQDSFTPEHFRGAGLSQTLEPPPNMLVLPQGEFVKYYQDCTTMVCGETLSSLASVS